MPSPACCRPAAWRRPGARHRMSHQERAMAHGSEHPIAALVEATALHTEIAHQRLALEWGQMMLTHVVQLWGQLEALEAMAYEDKVAAQFRMLDETTGSL